MRRHYPFARVTPVLTRDDEFEKIRSAAPELLVSWFFPKKIPARVLTVAKKGALGLHPSLLPRHRGADPYYWAILAGDAETGVTAHRLREEYDTGEILATRTLAIDPSWNAWTLAKKLDRPSLALLRELVKASEKMDDLGGTPQDESRVTLAPEPSENDLAIRWNEPTRAVVRQILAASPWPGAHTWFGETLVTITRGEAATRYPRALVPGEAERTGAGVVVRTADGAILLLEGRDEGEGTLRGADLASLLPDTDDRGS